MREVAAVRPDHDACVGKSRSEPLLVGWFKFISGDDDVLHLRCAELREAVVDRGRERCDRSLDLVLPVAQDYVLTVTTSCAYDRCHRRRPDNRHLDEVASFVQVGGFRPA